MIKKMSPFLLIGLIIAGVAAYIFFKKEREMHFMSAEQMIENRMENPGVVIDVRTSREFNDGHLKITDHNYDFLSGEFTKNLAILDKNETYYLYCASGNRSGKAAKLMSENGFENVYNIGGFNSLVQAGLESE